MKAWVNDLMKEKSGLQIAPLIDVVFLLLIYFMVSSRLKRPEADLGLALPGSVSVSTQIDMPDEQIINISSDGKIILNNYIFYQEDKSDLIKLEKILVRYKATTKLSNSKALIVIAAEDDAVHERVIDVLNVCAAAEIKHITFDSSL